MLKKLTPYFFFAITALASLASEKGWLTDIEEAKKKASAENKEIFVYFTGSTWCQPCLVFDKEVLSTESFKAFLHDQFVPVELDFPPPLTLGQDLSSKNGKLMKKYSVKGFPTIIIMNSEGQPYSVTNFQRASVDYYINHFEQIINTRRMYELAHKGASQLEGLEKAESLIFLLNYISPQFINFYQEDIDTIIANDPKDTTGFREKTDVTKKLDTLQASLEQLMLGGQPDKVAPTIREFAAKNELPAHVKESLRMRALNMEVGALVNTGKIEEGMAVIDQELKRPNLSASEHQEILSIKVNKYLEADNLPEALKGIDALIAVAPDSLIASSASKVKEMIIEKTKSEQAAKDAAEKE